MRRILFAAVLACTACERPVDRPAGGSAISGIEVEPQFLRRDRPLLLHIGYLGRRPTAVRYALEDQTFECQPEERSPGVLTCVHDQIDPNAPQGHLPITVTIIDEDGLRTGEPLAGVLAVRRKPQPGPGVARAWGIAKVFHATPLETFGGSPDSCYHRA